MRRVTTAALGVLLSPGFVVLPALGAEAQPGPVEPSITTWEPTGVDAAALAALGDQATEPGPARPFGPGAGGTTGPVVLTAPRATDPFDVLGVTWQGGQADLQVSVRVRADGAWSGWEVLGQVDEGPDPHTEEHRRAGGRTGTSPLVTEDADGVQVRVDAAGARAPRGLEVHLVDAGDSPADDLAAQSPAGGPSADAATTAPAIITRQQWGADESLTTGPHDVNQTVKAMILHHTAGSNSYSREGAFAQIRGIYAYHTRSLGWADIGYNLVVDRYGRTFEGRRGSLTQAVRGAHSGGFNTDTYGISVMGDFSASAVPDEAVDAVERAVGWKLGQYGVDPQGTALLVSQGGGTARTPAGTEVRIGAVSGHRDVGQTTCPGASLYARLPAIRAAAAALAPGTARIDWQAFPRDWTGDRVADLLARDAQGRLMSYPGDAQGGFLRPRQIGANWNGLATISRTGDLTGNRTPDVVARHQDGDLYLYQGDGRGGFGSTTRLGPGWGQFTAVLGVGDWNSDGRNDMVAANRAGALLFYAGDGAGGFRTARQIGTGWQNLSLLTAAGDFDRGGAADVVGRSATGQLLLYTGDGAGGIDNTRVIGTGWGAMTALLGPGDWDRDGRHDLIARAASGQLYLYPGAGVGALGRGRQIGNGWGSLTLVG